MNLNDEMLKTLVNHVSPLLMFEIIGFNSLIGVFCVPSQKMPTQMASAEYLLKFKTIFPNY